MEKLENKIMLLEFMQQGYILSSKIEYNEMNWEFLIQVVEKIEALRDGEDIVARVTIADTYCEILMEKGVIEEEAETKREAVYNACVEFVKCYTK